MFVPPSCCVQLQGNSTLALAKNENMCQIDALVYRGNTRRGRHLRTQVGVIEMALFQIFDEDWDLVTI